MRLILYIGSLALGLAVVTMAIFGLRVILALANYH